MANTPNNSLLSALFVAEQEIELGGSKFTIYELESQMVGLLLLEMEAAANSGVAVLSLLNPSTGKDEQYFKNSWWKIGSEAQNVVFTLLAFSLGEFDRNEQGVPKARLENVRRISLKHIVPLLRAIAEANQSFFDELQSAADLLKVKMPGLSSALSGMLGIQNQESENSNPNQSELQPDGMLASQP